MTSLKRGFLIDAAIIIAIFALMFGWLATRAQAQTVSIPVGQSAQLAWDYNPTPTDGTADGFRIELNGSQLGADHAPGVRQAPFTAPAICGLNTLRVAAFNTAAVRWSSPLSVQVTGCPPGTPTNLRLILTQQAGTDLFKLQVEAVVEAVLPEVKR